MKPTPAAVLALLTLPALAAPPFLSPLGRPPLGGPHEYDIREHQKTDTNLILCVELPPIPVPLRQPTGLAIGTNGALWCAGDSNLVHLAADGRRLTDLTLPDAPRCLAVGADGHIYVGLRTHVLTLDPISGTRSAWADLGENAVITSLAVTTNRLYAADAGGRRVAQFDLSGALLSLIGDKDPARDAPGFLIPSANFDLALTPDGNLWIVNPGHQRVENYDPSDGRRLSAWGKSGMAIEAFCGCCNPSHLAIRPDGSFVTAEKGLPRVKIYDPKGGFRGVVAGVESFDETATGLDLAIDSANRILVLDPARRLIRIFVDKPPRTTEAKP